MTDNRKIKRRVRSLQTVATLSISMMLFLLGSGGYLVATVIKAGGRMQERATIHVFLKTTADSLRVVTVGNQLSRIEAIKGVAFKSKADALEEFKAMEGEDAVMFLSENPLPDSYEVMLRSQYTMPDSLIALERRIGSIDGVDEVVYQRAIMSNLSSNINKLNLVLMLFGGALLLITLVLLHNTIRLAIYSRRQIISTMKLVGATKRFIIRPFIRESFIEGIIAWIVSGGMFWLLISSLNEQLPVYDQIMGLWTLGIMLVISVGISVLFTVVAVNNFVKMNSAKIELY